MPSLLGLPNETLIHIISYVMPDDIESFTGCCRLLNVLAEPVLREHRRLKRTQSCLYLDSEQDGYGMSSVIRELCAIERNPLIAFYRTKVYYEDVGHRVLPHDPLDPEDHVEYTPIENNEVRECIGDIVSRSLYIDEDEREVWTDCLFGGQQNPAFVLMLTLLPNLRKLDLNCASLGSISATLLGNVSRINRDAAGCQALSKLFDVGLESAEPDDFGYIGTLALFARLPSVRLLHGSVLEGEGFEKEYWPFGVSQVTEIDIAYSWIDGLCFSNFLRGFSNLRSFRLTIDEESLAWDVNAIRKALLRYAHMTLESLAISVETSEFAMDSEFDIEKKFFGSLIDFKVLSVIRMDFQLFVEPVTGKTKRLVDMLPASVKSLTLTQERDFDEGFDLFAGLAELRYKRLPDLEEIILYADQISDHEISLCDKLGISVLFMGVTNTGSF